MRRLALGLAWSFGFAWLGSRDCCHRRRRPRRPLRPSRPTQFDYYVMTLSWAPGFCDLGGKETSSPECEEGSGDGFVVHGLWPNNEFRPNPEVCRGQDATPADLDDEHGVYPNDRLAAYEYRKHGTCTGLSPHDYFATVRSVRARLKIPADVSGDERAIAHGARRDRTGVHDGQPQSASRQHGDQLQQRRAGRRAVLPGEGSLVLRRLPQGRAPHAANADRSWSLRCVEHRSNLLCPRSRFEQPSLPPIIFQRLRHQSRQQR